MASAPARPQFCAWCGTPIGYDEHEHEPRYEELARRERIDVTLLPERVRELLTGESYVTACAGCRTISHVVGHRPPS